MDHKLVVTALPQPQFIIYPPLCAFLALMDKLSLILKGNVLILAAQTVNIITSMPRNVCAHKPNHSKMLMENALLAYFPISSTTPPEDARAVQKTASTTSSWVNV